MIKKALSLVVLMTGVYFIGKSAPPDLGEVIDYVGSHPQHQEIILNKIMYEREKNNRGYSSESLGNFSRALLFEFSKKRFLYSRENIKENDNPKKKKNSGIKSELLNFLYDFIVDSDEK